MVTSADLDVDFTQLSDKENPWILKLIPGELYFCSDMIDAQKGIVPETTFRVFNSSGEPRVLRLRTLGKLRIETTDEKLSMEEFRMIKPSEGVSVTVTFTESFLDDYHKDSKDHDWMIHLDQLPVDSAKIESGDKMDLQKMAAVPSDKIAQNVIRVGIVGKEEYKDKLANRMMNEFMARLHNQWGEKRRTVPDEPETDPMIEEWYDDDGEVDGGQKAKSQKSQEPAVPKASGSKMTAKSKEVVKSVEKSVEKSKEQSKKVSVAPVAPVVQKVEPTPEKLQKAAEGSKLKPKDEKKVKKKGCCSIL